MFYISPNVFKQKKYEAFFRNDPENWAKEMSDEMSDEEVSDEEVSDEETNTNKNYLLPININYALPDILPRYLATLPRKTVKRTVTVNAENEKQQREQILKSEKMRKQTEKLREKKEKERMERVERRAYKTAKEIGTPGFSPNLGGKPIFTSRKNRRTQKLR
jgi:hypothetical protein